MTQETPSKAKKADKDNEKRKKKKKAKTNEKTLEDFFSNEGMSSQLEALQNNQEVLTNGMKALQPLMQQASSMLKGLPSGFLDKALKNLSKNNVKNI